MAWLVLSAKFNFAFIQDFDALAQMSAFVDPKKYPICRCSCIFESFLKLITIKSELFERVNALKFNVYNKC